MYNPFLLINLFLSVVSVISEDLYSNAKFIYTFFRERGWTTQAISGMLSNMQGDSGIIADFDGENGKYGLLQWNKSILIDWASTRRYNYSTIETQCKRIQWEVESGEHYFETLSYPISFRDYTGSYSPASYLSQIFLANYEQVKDQYRPNRWEWAREWYKNFTEGEAHSDAVLPGGDLYIKYETGESIESFAARYGVSVDDIAKWNYISNFQNIRVGRPLIVNKSGEHKVKYHVVQKDQTIFELTQTYGISQSQLCLWNNIYNADVIKINQMIRIG